MDFETSVREILTRAVGLTEADAARLTQRQVIELAKRLAETAALSLEGLIRSRPPTSPRAMHAPVAGLLHRASLPETLRPDSQNHTECEERPESHYGPRRSYSVGNDSIPGEHDD